MLAFQYLYLQPFYLQKLPAGEMVSRSPGQREGLTALLAARAKWGPLGLQRETCCEAQACKPRS